MKRAEREQVFGQWITQYEGLIFKFVRAYAFTLDDQDDLYQEITLQIWNSIPNFRGNSSAMTWLYSVTMNTAISWSKKETKHGRGKLSLDRTKHLLRENPKHDSRLDWLYEQIAHLAKIDRALMLLMLDGFSYKEMAEILGISASNVGVKINRIKKNLISESKRREHHGV